MWAWLRASSLALALGSGAAIAAPERVVSVNLCTDQLALLLAAPGQLVSVSALSQDPRISAMPAAAAALPANHGRAEEVFLLRPDLVLAGSYTTPAATAMLRRLGVRVETLEPARSFEDVRENLRRVGGLLGRAAEAEALVAAFDEGLLRMSPAGGAPSAAIYEAQGYMAGTGTLAADILRAAGFRNVAEAAGLTGGGFLPLERLVLLAPDLVVRGTPQQGTSRAEDLLLHPALRQAAGAVTTSGPDWTCGTPAVLRAAEQLADAAPPPP